MATAFSIFPPCQCRLTSRHVGAVCRLLCTYTRAGTSLDLFCRVFRCRGIEQLLLSHVLRSTCPLADLQPRSGHSLISPSEWFRVLLRHPSSRKHQSHPLPSNSVPSAFPDPGASTIVILALYARACIYYIYVGRPPFRPIYTLSLLLEYLSLEPSGALEPP